MILKKLTDQFLKKGVLGGSRVWFVVGGLGALLRLAGRVWGREPEVIFREKLDPGEEIVITHEMHPKVLVKEAKRADRAQSREAARLARAARKAAKQAAREPFLSPESAARTDDRVDPTP